MPCTDGTEFEEKKGFAQRVAELSGLAFGFDLLSLALHWGRGVEIDVDGLDVGVIGKSVFSEFSSDTGLLVSTWNGKTKTE